MNQAINRRQFLQFGTVALGGLWLPDLLRAGAGNVGRARACILLYLDGGPSHIDLWDMRPSAPAEIRGPFRPITTSVAGIRVCEHLPLTARHMHRLAQVRSVRHTETVHDPAVYQMLTGRKHVSSAGNLTVQPGDFPQLGTAFGKVDRRPAVMPKVIELGTPRVRAAFALEQEPAAVRQRYGLNRQGQAVLLARRLVEAGARFVTVYWGMEMQDWADGQGRRLANNPWDTHRNHFPLLKDELLPRADRALAALVDDLHQRGLLAETLVVWMGDFGRTPRIDRKYASRDHWPHANTVLFAGAGVPGGAVYGRTDRFAAEVTEDPVSPADLTATIFQLLGVNPRTPIRDGQGRAYPVSEGTPIKALLG